MKRRPKLLIIAGPNGTGKTTVTSLRANEGKLVKQYAPMHEWAKLIYENTI